MQKILFKLHFKLIFKDAALILNYPICTKDDLLFLIESFLKKQLRKNQYLLNKTQNSKIKNKLLFIF